MTKEDFLTYCKQNPNAITERCIKSRFPDLYDEIISFTCFPDDFSFTQKVYHFLNNDPSLLLGLCPVCGRRTKLNSIFMGYRLFCCKRCSSSSDLVQSKMKQTRLDRYGDENYNNTDQYKKTCLERYGVENPSTVEAVKEKRVETYIDNYGCSHPSQSDEIKEKKRQTYINHYGVDHYFRSDTYKEQMLEWVDDAKEKEYLTKKKNNSFNSSKIEDQLEEYLRENNINYIHQYRSDKYPFNCDFYFPEYDLYVEIQGSWTHGGHPFTGSDEDMNVMRLWESKGTRYYDNAISVWTVRDVEKRETAKKNMLNWVEIFSCDLGTCLKSIYDMINGREERK